MNYYYYYYYYIFSWLVLFCALGVFFFCWAVVLQVPRCLISHCSNQSHEGIGRRSIVQLSLAVLWVVGSIHGRPTELSCSTDWHYLKFTV